MTEHEWLTCTEPRLMLDHLKGIASPRQLRLFACACVRMVWSYLIDERSQLAVEVAEGHADGRYTSGELAGAEVTAFEVARIADLRATVSDPSWAATRAAARAANLDPWSAASGAAFIAALCVAPWEFGPGGGVVHHGDPTHKAQVRIAQTHLLREIIGNPFQRKGHNADWLTWNNGVVKSLAQTIYDEGRYTEVHVLGDALEEAGCSDSDILNHCRIPNPVSQHVRGCWVIDLLLEKNR